MKKLMVLLASVLLLSATTHAYSGKEKLMEFFAKTYPDAKSVVWEESATSYNVFFIKDKISHRLMYDLEGNITRAIRYYAEDLLPPMICNKVKKRYPGFRITGVTEFATESETSYHLSLDDGKTIMNVKSDTGGSCEVESKFKKNM